MFELFRTKMRNEACCRLKYETDFIENGTSATNIYVIRTQLDKKAGLVINEKEGPDTAIVFTYLDDDKDKELLKPDYFIWKHHTYFVYENVDLVLETYYKKQRAYQCNVHFNVGDERYAGYFVASLSSYLETPLAKNLVITNADKPILIMPHYEWLKVGLQFKIDHKPWKVIDFDTTTNPGVAYISLDLDFFQKNADVIEDDLCQHGEIEAGREFEVFTADGYFTADKEVEITKHTSDIVKFKVPYGLDSITISVKDDGGQLITQTFKVVVHSCSS